jgi:acyl dehydratase
VTVPASAVGTVLPATTATIERGRLCFFAEAIGETDPIYTDLDAAVGAGFPDLPVPPTFLFGLKLDGTDPFGWIRELGIDMRYVLHGTQRFTYASMAFAGDEVTFRPRIAEVFDKRGGALEFVTLETTVTRGDEQVATLGETIVVRHPELEAAR